ncbi:hypothetical protein IAR55_002676 [Kwoniella newhampshirensis]|uniref:Uncharacterized protein n=1 Tax=Kwoniella newhampshirensis TaxID=1651941 RepID=A0AAW0YZ84_9TREE
MFFLYPIVIFLFSALLSTSAAPLPYSHSTSRQNQALTPYTPVRWLTHFGTSIPDDTVINLEWEGGSGEGFEVYYIPQWPHQTDYAPVDIANTVENHFTWRTPKRDAYPEGTTFILGINDALQSLAGGWYDVTGLMSFGRQ